MNPEHARIVLCTAPGPTAASQLARQLVSERLAACANIVPAVNSVFLWQGALEEESEALMILKTTEACYPALERRLQQLHPYEVPEIIATTPSAGLDSYLAWLSQSTSPTFSSSADEP